MTVNELRYDQMVEDALRSVVRRSLTIAAEQGLPGNHHFYVTFKTEHPLVDIPEDLCKRYPSEMTIVLQNQFWDLKVLADRFEVTLSFSSVPHRLKIPFSAVIAFADPSVRFGLQFDVSDGEADPDADRQVKVEGAGDRNLPKSNTDDEKRQDDKTKAPPQANGEGQAAKVVTLDSFRKK